MAHILDGDGLRTRAGWCCPGCSRCYGPQVDECPHCPDGETGKVPDEGPEPIVYTDKGWSCYINEPYAFYYEQ